MTQSAILSASSSPGVSQALKNRIINGAMVIDQRNAGASVSFGTGYVYYVDRWEGRLASGSGSPTIGQSTTAPAGFVNSLLMTNGTGASPASGATNTLIQGIEGYNLADLNWGSANAKTVTLSFWVRSSLTGTFSGSMQNSAGNRSYPFTYTISSANTWTQAVVTVAGDTTGTWLTNNGAGMYLYFDLGTGSTYQGTANTWGAADYRAATGSTQFVATTGATFYITGVQLEVGTTATNFEYRQYTTELQLCQRYYWRINGGVGSGSQVYNGVGTGNILGSTSAQVIIPLNATMRSSATISYGGSIYASDASSSQTITTLGTNYGGTQAAMINMNFSGASFNLGRGVVCYTGSSLGTDWIAGSAEL